MVSTGRSDYPNQVNNVLCFPGLFRGVLDARASDVNDEMKVAAAYAIAGLVSDEELNPEYVLPKHQGILVPYLDILKKDLEDREE